MFRSRRKHIRRRKIFHSVVKGKTASETFDMYQRQMNKGPFDKVNLSPKQEKRIRLKAHKGL